MIAVRTGGRAGPAYHEEIEEMDRELAKVTEDFMRAVDVETLRVATRSGEHYLSQFGSVFSLASRRASRPRENGGKAFA